MLSLQPVPGWRLASMMGSACRPWLTPHLCAQTAAGRSDDVRTLCVDDADDHTAPSDLSWKTDQKVKSPKRFRGIIDRPVLLSERFE